MVKDAYLCEAYLCGGMVDADDLRSFAIFSVWVQVPP